MRFSKTNIQAGPVGLDLDGDFVAAVQLSDGGVARAHSADLPAGLLRDGEVEDPAALSEELKQLFRTHGLPKRVNLGVANRQVAVRQIELPLIEDPTDRVAAIRFQAEEAIAMPLDEATMDYQVVGQSEAEDGTTRLRVIVVAAREAMIGRLLESARGAGLKVDGIDLSAFALVRALADQTAMGYDAARVYCHLGGVSNLAIAVGPSCLFTRPIAVTVDGQATEDFASALAEEIRLSLDYYLGQPEAPIAGDVVLSGPGSKIDGLAEELGLLVDLPVFVAKPLGGLLIGGLAPDEDPTRLTVAAGLAIGGAG